MWFTLVPRANWAACGPVEALRLPKVGERAHEAVSVLGEPRIVALVHIEHHPETSPAATATRPRVNSWPLRRREAVPQTPATPCA
ncbi:MAG: hypothetical protein OYL41_09825 [Acidobacteriota bacterium]|nr:hypothetical protein [Acidobacteriota bacterium]